MVDVTTRELEIAKKQGFAMVITHMNGRAVAKKTNGIKSDPLKRKSADSSTVSDWRKRFQSRHPGYSCKIYEGDLSVAHGRRRLANVRKSYDKTSPAKVHKRARR